MRQKLTIVFLSLAFLAFAGCGKAPEPVKPPPKDVAKPKRGYVSPEIARMVEEARKRPPRPGQKKSLWDYTGQSTDELIALETDYNIQSIIWTFDRALREKKETKALSQVELDIVAIVAMELEVNNGGFHQFFLNSSREFAAVLPASLDRAGCPITSKIASDALAYLQISGEATPAKISDALRRAGTKSITDLSEMDGRFFKYPERIADSLFAYIKTHRADIHLP